MARSQADSTRQQYAPETLPPLQILLAEDTEINKRLVADLLKKWGHTTIVAKNGQEALSALANQTVDVILMDIEMPVMDGLTATRIIREQERAAKKTHIPIVAMTAHALKGDRERCIEAGMTDYISKPINYA